MARTEANNGVWGGCWCMGFHPEGVGTGRTGFQNREAKHAHVRKGTVHQVLVYDGDACVGWCQYGPPAELPTIKNPKAYNTGLAGGGLVEAYPEQVEGREPQRGAYLHTGPENLFEELGFARDRKIAKWRWVMRRRVEP
jgi:hypothetical protein